MKKAAYLVVLVTAVTAAFVIGSLTSGLRASPGAPAGEGRRVLHYACPMHPTYTSKGPGTAPCCGMAYEPVYEDGKPADGAHAHAPLGTVHVADTASRAIGLEVAEVRPAAGDHRVRLFGRVAADERRLYTIKAGIEGTVRDVAPLTTGSRVRRHQVLGAFTAPEFVMTVQSFILAVDAMERRVTGQLAEEIPQFTEQRPTIVSTSPSGGVVVNSANSNFRQRVDRLQLLGMSDMQINEIAKTKEVPSAIKIVSPADGVVLSRNVSPGRTFERGEELFVIGDLGRVWVLAELFGDDAARVQPGMEARIRVSGDARVLSGRVGSVPLQYNPASGARTVRIEVENPGEVLRPEMTVDVELASAFASAIVLPAEAVIDTGLRRSVFVERSPGAYEPREVEIGWRREGRVQITRGLEAGERVVIAGTFLLDSDSRIRLATGR